MEFLHEPMDPPGAIKSEVGPPRDVSVPLNGKDFVSAYYLRKLNRKHTIPTHQFGGARIGDAFAALTLDTYNLPAVGSKIIIHPKLRAGQVRQCNAYKNIRADALYIIQVPTCLGMSGKLFLYAPEYDDTTRTRGVYWQYASSGYICVYLPFSSDIPVIRKDVARQGMCGLSLGISLEIDNTSEGPVSPLEFNVWSMVKNIHMTELTEAPISSVVFPSLRFTPVVNPKPPPPPLLKLSSLSSSLSSIYSSEGEVQMADNGDFAGGADVNAEDAVTKDEPTVAVIPSTPEKTVSKRKPKHLPTMTKKQAESIGQKYILFHTATILIADKGKVFSYKINPRIRQAAGYNGEEATRPYMRNVFVGGNLDKGYQTFAEVTMRTTKSAYVDGIIQLSDSTTGYGNQIYAKVGGADVTFELMADQQAQSGTGPEKLRTQSWMTTNSVTYSGSYTLVSMNRTDSVGKIDVSFYYRIGAGTTFHVPKKAAKPSPPTEIDYHRSIEEIEEDQGDGLSLHSLASAIRGNVYGETFASVQGFDWENFVNSDQDYQETWADGELGSYDESKGFDGFSKYVTQYGAPKGCDFEELKMSRAGGDEIVSTMIAPAAGTDSSLFITETSHGEDDMIEQNENWLCIGKFGVPSDGSVLTIPLNLPVIADLYSNDGDNPIVETFRRYTDFVAQEPGQLGPVYGQYMVQFRLPTTHTANIAHVCVPGDMSETAAEFAFGLTSLLSLATSAITSVGGPLLATALNTANAATGGLAAPLLGAAGSLIPKAFKAIGKMINPPAPTPADVMAPIIGGDIPIGRFLSFLKPVMQNEMDEPALPTLALQLIDKFFPSSSRDDEPVPCSVYIRVGNVGVAREVFDRDVVYEAETPAIRVTPDEASRLIDKCLNHGKSEIAKQLAMTLAMNRFSDQTKTINVLDLNKDPYDKILIRDYYRSLEVPLEQPQRMF